MGIFLSPKITHLFGSVLAESLLTRKVQESKLTFSKILARKRAPENSRRPFQGKNPLKTGNYTILGGFENPRRGRQARNLTTNVPKILDQRCESMRRAGVLIPDREIENHDKTLTSNSMYRCFSVFPFPLFIVS